MLLHIPLSPYSFCPILSSSFTLFPSYITCKKNIEGSQSKLLINERFNRVGLLVHQRKRCLHGPGNRINADIAYPRHMFIIDERKITIVDKRTRNLK